MNSAFRFGIRKSPSPCYQCEDRSARCHSSCDMYIAYKEKIEKEKRKVAALYNEEYIVSDFALQGIRRCKKKRDKK